MKKWLIVSFLSIFATNASAQTAENIKSIENYLNNISSMEANFIQMSSNGGTAEGTLSIKKPNKIRMVYDDPTNVLIVGDGDFIVYNDTELDQVTHIDYDDIPASLLLTKNVKIDGKNIKVTDFYQDSGSTTIALDYVSKGDIGPITLVFSNNPMELKQWKIVDPQSVEVSVSLYDIKKDVEIKDDVFKFKKKKSSPMNYKKK